MVAINGPSRNPVKWVASLPVGSARPAKRRVAVLGRLAVSSGLLLTMFGCSAGQQPSALATVPPTASATPAASTTPSPTLPQASRWGLSFAYPTGWAFSGSTVDEHYIIVLGFLGSGSGDVPCTSITPPPGQSFPVGAQCFDAWTVPPGTVVMRFEKHVGLGALGVNSSDRLPGEQITTVAGLPAYFTTQVPTGVPDADANWTWTFPIEAHAPATGVYVVTVVMRGPGLPVLEGQVQAVIASIRMDPAAPPSASPSGS